MTGPSFFPSKNVLNAGRVDAVDNGRKYSREPFIILLPHPRPRLRQARKEAPTCTKFAVGVRFNADGARASKAMPQLWSPTTRGNAAGGMNNTPARGIWREIWRPRDWEPTIIQIGTCRLCLFDKRRRVISLAKFFYARCAVAQRVVDRRREAGRGRDPSPMTTHVLSARKNQNFQAENV